MLLTVKALQGRECSLQARGGRGGAEMWGGPGWLGGGHRFWGGGESGEKWKAGTIEMAVVGVT